MTWLHKGPFKYYVSKIVGGWLGGWVGVARCLRNMLKFTYLATKFPKILFGWVGFPKSYVIFRVGHGKCLHLLTKWVGGVKKRPKTCLHNI